MVLEQQLQPLLPPLVLVDLEVLEPLRVHPLALVVLEGLGQEQQQGWPLEGQGCSINPLGRLQLQVCLLATDQCLCVQSVQNSGLIVKPR